MSNFMLAVSAFDFKGIFSNILTRWYYYLALLLFVVFVITFSLLKKKKRNNLSHTQKIAYTAMFSALCFLSNYFTIKASDVLQISLVATTGFVAGYMMGSGLGFLSAFLGDLICGIIAPFGAYNPIIGIGPGLWGFIPGLLFETFEFNKYVKIVISFVLGFIFNSFLVNTFGLWLMYPKFYEINALLVLLPYKLIVVLGNLIVSIFIAELLDKVTPKNKFFNQT